MTDADYMTPAATDPRRVWQRRCSRCATTAECARCTGAPSNACGAASGALGDWWMATRRPGCTAVFGLPEVAPSGAGHRRRRTQLGAPPGPRPGQRTGA